MNIQRLPVQWNWVNQTWQPCQSRTDIPSRSSSKCETVNAWEAIGRSRRRKKAAASSGYKEERENKKKKCVKTERFGDKKTRSHQPSYWYIGLYIRVYTQRKSKQIYEKKARECCIELPPVPPCIHTQVLHPLKLINWPRKGEPGWVREHSRTVCVNSMLCRPLIPTLYARSRLDIHCKLNFGQTGKSPSIYVLLLYLQRTYFAYSRQKCQQFHLGGFQTFKFQAWRKNTQINRVVSCPSQ